MLFLQIPGFALLIYSLLTPNQGVGSGRIFLAILMMLLAAIFQIYRRFENDLR